MAGQAAAHAALAAALLAALRAQDFAGAAAGQDGGAAAEACPSLDLAVVDFAAPGGPRWANVLLSREFPDGLAATIAADAGPVAGIRFDADQRDARGDSVVWLPGADWSRLDWAPLRDAGPGAPRFVAPYPASLLKLMVAVGVAVAVEGGRMPWPDELEPMIVLSDNEATDRCVALLHRAGLLTTAPGHALGALFAGWGLATLRIDATTPRGGWRNADGAGVGRVQMTAWDTVRLLWLIDPAAPPAPWLPRGAPTLQPAAKAHLHAVLARQRRDEILSSGSLRGRPGWRPGLPDAPVFAHKTGLTDNYASDAGIVHDARRHYLVAVLSSLGRRHGTAATDWRLPALGAAIDGLLARPRDAAP